MTFTADLKELHQAARAFPKAAASTLNRVGRSLRSEMSRQGRKAYNIRKKDLDVAIGRNTKASPTNLVTKISLRRKRISLVAFGAREDRVGVRVAVRKGDRKRIPGAFIAGLKVGRSVGKRVADERIPIKHIPGPSVMQIVASRTVRPQLNKFIRERLPAELARNIVYLKR